MLQLPADKFSRLLILLEPRCAICTRDTPGRAGADVFCLLIFAGAEHALKFLDEQLFFVLLLVVYKGLHILNVGRLYLVY